MVKAHILNSKLIKSNFRFTKMKHVGYMSYVVCRMFIIFMNFLLHNSGTFHLYLPSFFTRPTQTHEHATPNTHKISTHAVKTIFQSNLILNVCIFICRWDCNEEDMAKKLDRIKDESIGDAISTQSAVFKMNVRTKKCL